MTELLRYEVPGKGRHYIHPIDSHRMPSVTNVLGVLPKPWLAPWAAKEERALVVRTAGQVFDSAIVGPELGGWSTETFLEQLNLELPHKKAHASIRDAAGDDGTQAHAAIEWRINGFLGLPRDEEEPELSIAARCGVEAWDAWQRSVTFRPAHAEKRMYSDDLDIAGTTDVICAHVDVPAGPYRAPVLADWKLTTAIRPEAEIQVAVLRHMAIERGLLDKSAWGLVMRLPKVPDEPTEERYLTPSQCEELVEVFRSARKIWDWASSE